MDKRSIEERVETLEAQNLAYGVALRAIVVAVFDTNASMRQRRDMVCQALDAMYEVPGIRDHAHSILQKALHEAEGLFAPGLPDPPRSDG